MGTMDRAEAEKIVAWANTHDCGVTPTAVLLEEPDGLVIEIRGTGVHADGRVEQFTERAHSYADVRAHLGY